MTDWKKTALRTTALSVALTSELRDTLLLLAEKHDNTAGPWLDELEKKALRGVKTMEGEGVGDIEMAEALRDAASDMRKVFSKVREMLQGK